MTNRKFDIGDNLSDLLSVVIIIIALWIFGFRC